MNVNTNTNVNTIYRKNNIIEYKENSTYTTTNRGALQTISNTNTNTNTTNVIIIITLLRTN